MTTGKLTGWLLALVVFSSGCKGEDKEPAKRGIRTENLFLECQVWGDEERPEVTILVQLREKNHMGRTVKLDSPGFAGLDGAVLQPDSSRLSGFFYEAQQPLAGFAGRHTITLAGETGRRVSEEFEYTPFTLATPLGDRVGKGDLVLRLSGLKNEDQLRVTLVDMDFYTQDINELMPVVNGRLHITREQLNEVAAGPVTLLLFKEEERRLQHPALRGGRLAVTYGLQREFELID